MSEAYGAFADVYEYLMDNVPYDEWFERIRELLTENGIRDGIIAELGCGTGAMTRRLSAAGYDMIGIDASPDMLEHAREYTDAGDEEADRNMGLEEDHPGDDETDRNMGLEEGHNGKPEAGDGKEILYLLQDMRSFELYGTVRAVVCCCDSINYITDPEEVGEVFRLVNNYLDPEGLLIMDFHTPYYYGSVLKERTIAEVREDVAMIWENEEAEDGLHRMYVTVFREEPDGSYRRFEEDHEQRGYTPEELRRLAKTAGLVDITFYDGYTGKQASDSSERIVMTAREHGKCPV